jgi:hypothetical protein
MPVGEVTNREVRPNRDGVDNKLLLTAVISDPNDKQTVELFTQSGQKYNPPDGAKLFVVESGKSWKIAVACDDGVAPNPDMAQGDSELYSIANGERKAKIYLAADGKIEFENDNCKIAIDNDGKIEIDFSSELVVNSGTDNAVRFSDLKAGFDQLKTDLNAFIQKYGPHTHTGGVAAGGLTGSPNPPIPLDSTATIDAAKIDEIKVP